MCTEALIATRSKLDTPSSFPVVWYALSPPGQQLQDKGPREIRAVRRDHQSGVNRSAFRHCFTARTEFPLFPRASPGRYALSTEGAKVSASRNPGFRAPGGTWMRNERERTHGAAREVTLAPPCPVPSLICSFPVRICRSVLPRYEIAPAASVLLNYWITMAQPVSPQRAVTRLYIRHYASRADK